VTGLSPPLRIDALLRELAPDVLGALLRRTRDFGAAEDAVQEALVDAATQWPREGVPDDPRAWLVRVASRRRIDRVRADAARRRREEIVVSLGPRDEELAFAADADAPDGDDTLLLLFMCCHPALTQASAVALTLRAVGGLTTRELARAFLVPEATMAQRISRAKETIERSRVPFERPGAAETAARLASVLRVLYLVFNEGYAASSGSAVQRMDLAEEAIRIARVLHERLPEEREVGALLALMLLTDARRDARTGPNGELVPLDEQDRRRWSRARIAEGLALASAAIEGGVVGPYAAHAAIAALHDEAPDVATTDWREIRRLYDRLSHLDPSPMVRLNRAIATAMIEGAAAGLVELDALATDAHVRESHRLDAVRAHLLEREGAIEAAIEHYARAAERTASTREREYLLMRAARLRER
jgi:RNA polymerase sigma factor (sigma-70 family)